MTKPTILIVDAESGEEISREMNDAEFAQYEADQAEFENQKEQKIAKAEQRLALLSRLGITEEEAKILLGGN